jgi:hypothetical protein
MKRIVRLTESDLVRLVKRVVNEQMAQGVGPNMTQVEAQQIARKLNSSGTMYVDESFNVVKPFKLVFFISPQGSGGRAFKEFEQEGGPKTQEFTFTIGSKFNVDTELTGGNLNRLFSGISARTTSNSPIKFAGKSTNDQNGMISTASLVG